MHPCHVFLPLVAFLLFPVIDATMMPAAAQAERVHWQCNHSRNPKVRIRACTHIIRYHPGRVHKAWAHHYRGIAYWKLGQARRAIADFDRAIRLNPADADARRHKRYVLRQLRNRRRAR